MRVAASRRLFPLLLPASSDTKVLAAGSVTGLEVAVLVLSRGGEGDVARLNDSYFEWYRIAH